MTRFLPITLASRPTFGRLFRVRHLLLLTAACAVWVGCGDGSPSTGPAGDATSSDVGPPASQGDGEIVRRHVKPEHIEAPLPPLLRGEVEIAPPKGWKNMPRRAEYLVGFYESTAAGLPRILVTVEDAPAGGARHVNEENVAAFAKQVRDRLASEGVKLHEDVLPLIVNDVPCARYVTQAKFGAARADQQFLVTARHGRLFTIKLQVFQDKLTVNSPAGFPYNVAGYAVLASLKVKAPEGSVEPPTDEPAADKPAADKPADDKPPENKPANDKPAG